MVLLQSGCATLLTNATTKTTIETSPPGAVVVAIGGSAGDLIVTLKRGNAVVLKVLGWLSPHLTPTGKAALEQLSFEAFITNVVAWLDPSLRAATPMLAGIQAEFDRIPPPVAARIRGYLGLDRVGVAPTTCALKNGNSYAVIAYLPGHRATVGSLSTRINMKLLLNVFNGFVPGLVIDFLTGRWRVTTPDRLALALPPA